MGLFDEIFNSPEQSKNERAEREGVREAHEGSDILGDTLDEFTHGRDYVDLKAAAREGTREALRNDGVVDNISNDTYDEFAHNREYVDRKQYYRDNASDSSSGEESPNYASGGGYSYSPSSGSSSTDSSSDPTEGPAFVVAGLIVVGLLIWMFSCVASSIRKAADKPYKSTTLPTAMTSGPSGTSFYTGDGDPLAFQAYNDGDYFLKQSKYDQAIPYFAEAIRRRPDYWYAYVGRADAYRFLGRNDLALHDYDEAVRLKSNNPQGYLGRGMIEDRMGRCQEGINDINHALSLNPTELLDVYYRVRGMAYLDCGQYPSAIEDFNQTLRLKSNDSVSLGNRGAAYGRSGENERALEDYNQALKLDPANAWLYLGRGVTYEHLSQYEHAIRDFDEAIRLNPNLTEASTARQDAQARMNPTAAIDDASSPTPDSVATATEGETSSSGESIPPQNQVRSEFPDCYSGTWHENEPNQFTWTFRRLGNYLRISRTDGFVSGQFQKSREGWTGFLNWGNGTTWNGVVLNDANEACDEITTNQRWWYKR